jgi:cytochrome c oxidase subunit II
MYPDKTNLLWLHADQPGPYLGYCSEYCGNQHAWMLVQATALPPAEYDAWIAGQQQAQGALNSTVSNAGRSGGDPGRGLSVFRNNTCVNCHAITGETGPNNIAPNLTHLGQRKTLGTGIVQNNPTNLGRWIKNAAELKPGVLMPAYNFSEQDLRDLVAYLLEEKP